MLRFSHPLHLVLGFLIWSLWFVLSYSALSLACQFAPPADLGAVFTWINGMVLLLSVGTAALLLYLALRCWRRPTDEGAYVQQQRFVRTVAGGAYLAAAIATLAVGLPSVWLPPCL